MLIRFWGVRGSIPAPQLPSQIKSKISAVLERLTPDDLASEKTREKFLAELPPWLFGTAGGNTTCVSVTADNDPDNIIIFDCGSGIRELGMALQGNKTIPTKFHIFFSHFHWDHMQGLPFFNPAYNPSNILHFYSPVTGLQQILNGQMTPPYFPVHMESMGAKKIIHNLAETAGNLQFGKIGLSWKKMNHPGDSYSYRMDDGSHKFIFATDTELSASDFVRSDENISYYQDADLLVIDSQYTLGEAIEKYNWGHSAFSMTVDFAANWGIKHLVLFHHDPTYDDRKLYNILQSAGWYMERMNIKGIKLSLATEGLEILL
ncbi:MAG: MBL fold metallo-hydrolase [Treponema sp.]|nr:MBL fold metallo-hydrolase [Treponema sp.]